MPLAEDHILFSPGIYEHAAALIGERPTTVSRDTGQLYRAQSAAWKLYRHPMLVAGIDVYNVEPEAFGATVDQPVDNSVPCVIQHPFSSMEALGQLAAPDPAHDGRMPMVLEVAQHLVQDNLPTTVFVPVCGPLALAGGLVGMDELLCTMMEDPALAKDALFHLSTLQSNYVRAIVALGALPLIFESGASPPLLPPTLFREIEAPALRNLFAQCRALNNASPACILGGNVLPILDDLLALEPGFLICPSETDQPRFIDKAAARPHLSVRINMPVTSVLESDWKKNIATADHAIALARRLPHGSVGTGVAPFNASPEILLKLRDYVQQAQPLAIAHDHLESGKQDTHSSHNDDF